MISKQLDVFVKTSAHKLPGTQGMFELGPSEPVVSALPTKPQRFPLSKLPGINDGLFESGLYLFRIDVTTGRAVQILSIRG